MLYIFKDRGQIAACTSVSSSLTSLFYSGIYEEVFRHTGLGLAGQSRFCCALLITSRVRLGWAKCPINPWIDEVLLCLTEHLQGYVRLNMCYNKRFVIINVL
jgi:hypothetical protein